MNPFLHPTIGALAILLAFVVYRVDAGKEERGPKHRLLGIASVLLAGLALWMGIRAAGMARAQGMPIDLTVHKFLGLATLIFLVIDGVLGAAAGHGAKSLTKLHGRLGVVVLILAAFLAVAGLAGLGKILAAA